MILIIDNYDSFTYNIAAAVRSSGKEVQVVRNREITCDELIRRAPEGIIISPGPGTPDDAGISLEVVRRCAGQIPIMGICLGHQVIVQAFGGTIVRAPSVCHGKVDDIDHDGMGLFRNIAPMIKAVRYHSFSADRATIPRELEVTAWSRREDTIMGVRHQEYILEGVQFHPESIGTVRGDKILENFLSYRREGSRIEQIIATAAQGSDLTGDEATDLMEEITRGELSDSQLGALLGAMAVKGIAPVELSSFARVLRDKTGVTERIPGLTDTCGTGGDGKGTFNVSSAAALVCAAGGIPIAKHGNKAISSRSGSYDFFRQLGIPVDTPLDASIRQLEEFGFTFLFAPRYHQALGHAAKVRQELRMRTLFNLLGPMINPLCPDAQIVGVYDPAILETYARSLQQLGVKRGMVVHSLDGLDEISPCAPTMICEIREDEISTYQFDPAGICSSAHTLKDIQGENAYEHAQLFRSLLEGSHHYPAVEDGICLNAAAVFTLRDRCATIEQGYTLARELIASGAVLNLLHRMVKP